MHQEERLTEEGEEGVEDLLAGHLALALGVIALLLEGGAVPLGPFVSGWEPAGLIGRSSRRGGP